MTCMEHDGYKATFGRGMADICEQVEVNPKHGQRLLDAVVKYGSWTSTTSSGTKKRKIRLKKEGVT